MDESTTTQDVAAQSEGTGTGTATTPEVSEASQQLQSMLDQINGSPAKSNEASTAGESAEENGSQDGVSTAEKTPAGTPEATQFTEAQIQAAKHLGYSDADIKELSPTMMRMVELQSAKVRKMESQLGRLAQSAKGGTEKLSSTGVDDGHSEQTGGDPAQIAQPESHDNAGVVTFASDEFLAEESATKMNALAKQVQDLTGKLSKYEGERQEAARRQVEQKVDAFFDALDAKAFPQVGKGKFADLPQDSPEAAARIRITNMAGRIREGHREIGDDATEEQSLQEALAVLYPENVKQSIEASLRASHDKRKAGAVAKPSSNATMPRETDPEAEARQTILEAAHALGIPMRDA
jgi:hypothetical protein